VAVPSENEKDTSGLIKRGVSQLAAELLTAQEIHCYAVHGEPLWLRVTLT
jgi:hypothetical protein